MKLILQKIGKEWILITILLVAFILRFKNLTFQSLWLDELHTLNEADPDIPWSQMFNYLKCCDQHPPLYFIVERIAFIIFGHTEFVARIISVIAGTVSVWAVWQLGKELMNKSLGTIAAILTCVNWYNLWYSQEARGYIFAFLFAALSFTYLIKTVKLPNKRNALLYALFTLCLLYSHYYSLFVVVAQGILILLLLFQEKAPERKLLFRKFLLSGSIIVVGYLPWIPFLRAMSQIESFWIGDVAPDFMKSFFYEYFGNAELLKPILICLLLIYIVKVSIEMEQPSLTKVRANPLLFGFATIFLWVFITYLIPYMRSLFVVPMLFPRYTIVVLPAIMIALAYGIELFRVPLLKYLITGLFVIFSLVDIIVVKKYYTELTKTQFREMTEYVVKGNLKNYPIINQVTNWQQTYYLKINHSKATVLAGKKEDLVDSILRKSAAQYDVDGFWIVGAHGDKMPEPTLSQAIDTAYTLTKEKSWVGAWAQLYLRKGLQSEDYYTIRYNNFAPGEGTTFPDLKKIAIWGGAIHTKPITRKKGKFRVAIAATGTVAQNVYPHINIYCNDKKIGAYYVTDKFEEKIFTYDHEKDGDIVIKVEMDNDFATAQEDRNTLVEYIVLEKIQ